MSSLHLRIRASAGTGKTFRLTDRIIELLLLGAKPERIIALTFTRKAAGEFLTKTLRKLAELSSDPGHVAAFLARRSITEKKSPADFLPLLRRVAESLDRMEFGTLDSFFLRIISTFGSDLTPAPRIMDPFSAKLDDQEILADLAASLPHSVLIEELLRAPARASIAPLNADFDLIEKIEAFHALHPDPSAWGDAPAIWGAGGCPWFADIPPHDPTTPEVAAALEEIRSSLTSGKTLNAFASRLLGNATRLFADEAVSIPLGKKEFSLSPADRAAARAGLADFLTRTLSPKLRQARRWHEMATSLRALRNTRLASSNLLRFADLPVILARLTGDAPAATDLQYRLDGWFDHWLLDEFQDTSRIQWRAIQPLVDEVLQDTSGTRSFFYVGDVKQSIYSFRHGDPSLFDEIFQHYTKNAPGHIAEESLGESHRSAPEVIRRIQDTFNPSALAAAGIDPAVVEKWAAAWTPHSAHKNNPAPGHVHCIHCDPSDVWQHIIGIAPSIPHPLTCAVLVRTNKEARDALEALTNHGIPATTESSPLLTPEHPAGIAILMAARLIANPADKLASAALSCGPLGAPTPAFIERSLESFVLHGALGMVNAWLRLVKLGTRNSELGTQNPPPQPSAALRQAAHEFDRNGPSSPAAFARFLAVFASPASAHQGTVQILTIHKAKGLEYDFVFLPILSNTRMDKRDGADIFCHPAPHPWILALPSEKTSQADPILRDAAQSLRDKAAFDSLCALYVAETRARRALVLLLPDTKDSPSTENKSPTPASLLAFPAPPDKPDFSTWFAKEKVKISAAGHARPCAEVPASSLQPPAFSRSRPSDIAHGPLTGASLFSETSGLALGTEIHNLLAAIEWLPAPPLPDATPTETRRLIETFLAHPTVRKIFEHPGADAILWRERATACLLDNHTTNSAQMDRVIIRPPSADKPGTILLVDFKTDHGTPEEIAARYTPQIHAYIKILEAWSQNQHTITAALATVRSPALIPIPTRKSGE